MGSREVEKKARALAVTTAMQELGIAVVDFQTDGDKVTMSVGVYQFLWGLASAQLDSATAFYAQDGVGAGVEYDNATTSMEEIEPGPTPYEVTIIPTGD